MKMQGKLERNIQAVGIIKMAETIYKEFRCQKSDY